MIGTTTINLGHGNGNNCNLDPLQDIEMSKGVNRDGGYDNDDKNYDNGDGHIHPEGPLRSYEKNIGYIGQIKPSEKSGEYGVIVKVTYQPGLI